MSGIAGILRASSFPVIEASDIKMCRYFQNGEGKYCRPASPTLHERRIEWFMHALHGDADECIYLERSETLPPMAGCRRPLVFSLTPSSKRESVLGSNEKAGQFSHGKRPMEPFEPLVRIGRPSFRTKWLKRPMTGTHSLLRCGSNDLQDTRISAPPSSLAICLSDSEMGAKSSKPTTKHASTNRF